MTRRDDVEAAIHLGVDAVGFIFYERSSRGITIEHAMGLMQDLPPFVSKVAVLVDAEKCFVEELIHKLPLDVLQFHGDESPEYCDTFGISYIKAIHPKSAADIDAAIQRYAGASGLLLDSMTATARGGTGVTLDWSIIPEQTKKPLILAGGLNPETISQALACTRPYAVDVCSGVEMSPGIKDHAKMAQFVNAITNQMRY